MEFKKFSAGYKHYGISNPTRLNKEDKERDERAAKTGITNVNFEDEAFWKNWDLTAR